MSCFIVSNNHINAIVRWAAENYINAWHAASERHRLVACDPQPIAEELLRENTRSVNHSYQENEPVRSIVYDSAARGLSPVEVIKACQCLSYQSSEHPEWPTSLAHALLQAIERKAIILLPGYDAAHWEIE